MQPPTSWDDPPETLSLPPAEAHVWRAPLDLPLARLEGCRALLSPDERARAERFRRAVDRDRQVAARGILRLLLARYLGEAPERLRFRRAGNGKPALAEEPALPLRFNLSHSGGLALYAFALGREIGVDVEEQRPGRLSERLAARCFAPEENAALRALPEAERPAARLRCWTLKEAFLKARGDGLTRRLDRFAVSLHDDPPRLLRVAWDPAAVERWSLRALDPAPGYLAALAVEGEGWELRCWRWSG